MIFTFLLWITYGCVLNHGYSLLLAGELKKKKKFLGPCPRQITLEFSGGTPGMGLFCKTPQVTPMCDCGSKNIKDV